MITRWLRAMPVTGVVVVPVAAPERRIGVVVAPRVIPARIPVAPSAERIVVTREVGHPVVEAGIPERIEVAVAQAPEQRVVRVMPAHTEVSLRPNRFTVVVIAAMSGIIDIAVAVLGYRRTTAQDRKQQKQGQAFHERSSDWSVSCWAWTVEFALNSRRLRNPRLGQTIRGAAALAQAQTVTVETFPAADPGSGGLSAGRRVNYLILDTFPAQMNPWQVPDRGFGRLFPANAFSRSCLDAAVYSAHAAGTPR